MSDDLFDIIGSLGDDAQYSTAIVSAARVGDDIDLLMDLHLEGEDSAQQWRVSCVSPREQAITLGAFDYPFDLTWGGPHWVPAVDR